MDSIFHYIYYSIYNLYYFYAKLVFDIVRKASRTKNYFMHIFLSIRQWHYKR